MKSKIGFFISFFLGLGLAAHARAYVDPPHGEMISSWKVQPVASPLGAYVWPLDKVGNKLGGIGWITPELAAIILGQQKVDSSSQFEQLARYADKLKTAYRGSVLVLAEKYDKSFKLNFKVQQDYVGQYMKLRETNQRCIYNPLGQIALSNDDKLKATGRPMILLIAMPHDQVLNAEFTKNNCEKSFYPYVKNGGVQQVCVGSVSCGNDPPQMCLCDVVSLDPNYRTLVNDEMQVGVGVCPSADKCVEQCKNKMSHYGVPITSEPNPAGAFETPLRYGKDKWEICEYPAEVVKGIGYNPICLDSGSHCPSRSACNEQSCGVIDNGLAHFSSGTYK